MLGTVVLERTGDQRDVGDEISPDRASEGIEYLLEVVRTDDEFVLYRGEHPMRRDASSLPFLTPVSTEPALQTLEKIEHEYSFAARAEPPRRRGEAS